jgi:glycosyltransferase involved in cell wall biosynthesis
VRFGFAGTLRPHKGAHVALDAFALLHPGLAELAIHGDPRVDTAYGSALAARAASLGAALLPPFGRPDLDDVLTGLDCLIVPSLWPENAPLVARECLARKVPVLASRIGGLPETAPEGKGFHTFPPGDVAALAELMRELAADPARLEALADAAESPPTIAQHVDTLEAVYGGLAAAGGTTEAAGG